jgi:hypothetical protein
MIFYFCKTYLPGAAHSHSLDTEGCIFSYLSSDMDFCGDVIM